jgi:hypothetical protein
VQPVAAPMTQEPRNNHSSWYTKYQECCVVLCCVVLCCAVLCCAVLCCVVSCLLVSQVEKGHCLLALHVLALLYVQGK